MVAAREHSVFKLQNILVPTICRWTLIAIVSIYGKAGATIEDVKQCIQRLMEVTYDKDKNFLFWLGHGVSVESVFDRMESQGVLVAMNSVKRYFISERGQNAIKEWKPEIVETLQFQSFDELNRIASLCLNGVNSNS